MAYKLAKFILPLATAMGFLGGFPPAPNMIKKLQQMKLVQYLLLFVLIYQGGSGQDVQLALLTTLIVFIVNEALHMMEARGMM